MSFWKRDLRGYFQRWPGGVDRRGKPFFHSFKHGSFRQSECGGQYHLRYHKRRPESIATDGGATFANRTVADGLGANATYAVQVVAGPGSTSVYVGTNNGLSVSTDGGATFTNTPTGFAQSPSVTSLYVVGNAIYAGTSSGLLTSANGGATFSPKTMANSMLASNNIRSVYAVGNTVYVGTDSGLSISTDGGATFTTQSTANGLGSNQVEGLFVAGSTIFTVTTGGLSYCSAAALPVELISFTARLAASGNTSVDWQTAWEERADRFEVQRSTGSLERFVTLGTLMAQSGADPTRSDSHRQYQFTDMLPPAGINYYRLRQVDHDGTVTYSKPVAVDVAENQPVLAVAGNPVSGGVLQLNLRYWQANELRLMATSGQTVPISAEAGSSGLVYVRPQQPLAAGVYILSARRGNQQQRVRILWRD